MNRELSLAEVLKEGLVIRVSFHGRSLLSKTFGFEVLGVRPEDMEYFRPGKASFMPKADRKLASIAASVSYLTQKYSRSIEVVEKLLAGEFRWVSYDAYDSFVQDFQEKQNELAVVVAEILSDYDEALKNWLEYSKEQAYAAWRAAKVRYQTPEFDIGGVKVATEGEFVRAVVSKAANMVPTKERIRTDIYMEYHAARLFSDSDIAAEAAALARHNAARAEASAREAEAIRRAEEVRRLKLENDEREFKKGIRRVVIKAAMEARAREIIKNAVDPVKDILSQLYAEMLSGAEQVLAGLKSGQFRGRTISAVARIAECYRTLGGALSPNKDLEKVVGELESAVLRYKQSKGEAQIEDVIRRLEEIRAITKQEAKIIKQQIESDKARATSPLDDTVADVLALIVNRYNPETPKRCAALLNDLCPEYQRERNLLDLAYQAGVPQAIKKAGNLAELVAARMTAEIQAKYSLDEEAARWAVSSWVKALGGQND